MKPKTARGAMKDGPSELDIPRDGDEGEEAADAGDGEDQGEKQDGKGKKKRPPPSKNKKREYNENYRLKEQLKDQRSQLDTVFAELRALKDKPAAAAPPADDAEAERKRQAEVDAAVDKALDDDPEVKAIFEKFGQTSSPDQLAMTLALGFAPLSLLHECWKLYEVRAINGEEVMVPTAECRRLANGWYPLIRKHDKNALAWLKKYRVEMLAASVTLTFLLPRVGPTWEAITDPTKTALHRMREAAAREAERDEVERKRQEQQPRPAADRTVEVAPTPSSPSVGVA